MESGTRHDHLGCNLRTLSYQHIISVYYLFSYIGDIGADESFTGDVYNPGNRHFTGGDGTGRKARMECLRWDDSNISGFNRN